MNVNNKLQRIILAVILIAVIFGFLFGVGLFILSPKQENLEIVELPYPELQTIGEEYVRLDVGWISENIGVAYTFQYRNLGQGDSFDPCPQILFRNAVGEDFESDPHLPGQRQFCTRATDPESILDGSPNTTTGNDYRQEGSWWTFRRSFIDDLFAVQGFRLAD